MALIKCPECEKEISEKATACPNCGCPIVQGITKTTLLGKKIPVVCIKCGSRNCEWITEEFVYRKGKPAVTKAKYSANLNPLKPFTLVNKKEKVVKKATPDKTTTIKKIKCNDCGKIFS